MFSLDTIVMGLLIVATGAIMYKYGRNLLRQTPLDAMVIGALVVSIGLLALKRKRENMGGYGTISGLYYNNQAKHCFKNIYDDPNFSGYCEVIGRVVI